MLRHDRSGTPVDISPAGLPLDDAEAMVRLHLPRINLAEVTAAVEEFSAVLEASAPADAWREVRRRTRLD